MALHPIVINQGARPLTGTWSLTDLAKTSVTATIGVLARYMAGRVNPYTAVVGQQLCESFQLSMKGRQNVEQAIASLSAVSSIGDTLEFGFGVEDVVRSMVKTNGGSTCVALCAGLIDTYPDTLAAEVLLELANKSNIDGQFVPSGTEWKNLLGVCSGVLATTSFPLRAEFLMNLVKRDFSLGASPGTGRKNSTRRYSQPKDLAEALSILAQVSRGELEGITFIGGADIGWLAAIAEWLLDLKVSITDENGQLNYVNTASEDEVQVRLLYSSGVDQQSLVNTSKVYRLEKSQDLFDIDEGSISPCVSGRLEWANALSSAFPGDFKVLLEDPQTIGDLFGSAARLLKAIAEGNPGFSLPERRQNIYYSDASFGKGFIQNMIQRFPELSKLRDAMSRASSVPVEDARRVYDHCIALTKMRCECSNCREPENTGETDVEDDDADLDSEAEAERQERLLDELDEMTYDDKYCLVGIAETILRVTRLLATVSTVPGLCPKRSGFELIYDMCCSKRRLAFSHAGTKPAVMGQVSFLLDFKQDDLGTAMGSAGEQQAAEQMSTALELFTGRGSRVSGALSLGSRTSAICDNGICIFRNVLVEHAASDEAVSLIHVRPGRIYYQKKTYSRLNDRNPPDYQINIAVVTDAVQNGAKFTNKALIVTERSTSLDCLVELSQEQIDGTIKRLFAPTALACLLATSRRSLPCGRVYASRVTLGCNSRGLQLWSAAELERARESKLKILRTQDKTIQIIWCEDKNQLWAVMALLANRKAPREVYLANEECLPCCTANAVQSSRRSQKHIIIVYSEFL